MNRQITLIMILMVSPTLFGLVAPSKGWINPGGALYAQSVQPAPRDSVQGFWQQLKRVLHKGNSVSEIPKSVTEKYDLYYNWIHKDELTLYDSLSQKGVADWDRYQNIVSVQYKYDKDKTKPDKLASNIKVFGWHPYWMGNAWKSYQFNLLSYLSWFSYNIDPETGKFDNPEVIAAWENAGEMLDLAHANGCKVLLTITSHTKEGNIKFLRNPVNQQTLIDNLLLLLAKRGGDGIDVNFELVPEGLEQEMTDFLTNLSKRLKTANRQYVLTIDLPIFDYKGTYQLEKLNFIDLFVITGYDYYNVQSKTDGPVSPLKEGTGKRDIQHSVNTYLQGGIPREKLILGLPYYGAVWTSSGPGNTPFTFNKHITYRELKAKYCKETPAYDLERWSGFYTVPGIEPGTMEKCWFDDSLTLNRKFDWVVEHQLAGVGIWALGYDNGYPELWNLISTKFSGDTVLVYKEPYLENRYYKITKSLMEYRTLFAVAGIFIVIFLLAGLVVALFDWRVRDVFFQNKTLRLLYLLGGITVLISTYAFFIYITGETLLKGNSMLAWGAGLLVGVGMTLYLSHRYQKYLDELP